MGLRNSKCFQLAAISFAFLGLLLSGCTAPQEAAPEQPAPAQPQIQQRCTDGTAPLSCSAARPFFCTRDAQLVEDSQLCGCPAGTEASGLSCIQVCADGTRPGQCSPSKPLFCGSDFQLSGKASVCGCPAGEIRSGESCVRSCSDGTLPGECSPAKPDYCNDSAALAPDPSRCGCPAGTVLLGGECREAVCPDGTAAGSCSRNPPGYCSESLELTNNAQLCGCPSGQILSRSNSSCVNPTISAKREDSIFGIGGDIRLMARNSEYHACENGDYISVEVRVENNGYFSDFAISQGDLNLLVQNTRHFSDSGWMEMAYPENDSDCSEVSRFRWGAIRPMQFSSGIIWYKLKAWDRNAAYSLFYNDSYRIQLRPEYD